MVKWVLLVGVVLLVAGCKQPETPIVKTEPKIQCGCCLKYEGGTIPEDFWKVCNRMFDLDKERLDKWQPKK